MGLIISVLWFSGSLFGQEVQIKAFQRSEAETAGFGGIAFILQRGQQLGGRIGIEMQRAGGGGMVRKAKPDCPPWRSTSCRPP